MGNPPFRVDMAAAALGGAGGAERPRRRRSRARTGVATVWSPARKFRGQASLKRIIVMFCYTNVTD
jgi:hypothetical protein